MSSSSKTSRVHFSVANCSSTTNFTSNHNPVCYSRHSSTCPTDQRPNRMMPPDSLYGIKKPKATASKKDLTSASTLAFTTHLSSLISKGTASSPSPSPSDPTTHGRPRPSKSKPDIFSVRNKGSQKRAAADISDDGAFTAVEQVHKRGADIGAVDEAVLQRSKRRMAEKARLYAELKRGEYLAESSDEEEGEEGRTRARTRWAENNSLVDFDRKWAEEEAQREGVDDEDGGSEQDDGTLVEYEDEFGRTRQGTKAEAAEAARARDPAADKGEGNRSASASTVPASARPARPENLIYGSTVQAAAFNPDDNIAAQMAHLAKRRDRSPTPPEETHYDAEGEVRHRGTGFYAFSKDEAARKEEMEELMRTREETMKERSHAASKKTAREKAKEERRKKIEELRGKRRAQEFLNGLGSLVPSAATEKSEKSQPQPEG